MGFSSRFRDVHKELVWLVQDVEQNLQPGLGPGETGEVLNQLTRLVLRLAMENHSVYPQLLESPDPKVNRTARRFQNEMGVIQERFEGYADRWNPLSAREDPHHFFMESRDLLDVLYQRIRAEQAALSPLLDAMG